jgi:hypothetical protein
VRSEIEAVKRWVEGEVSAVVAIDEDWHEGGRRIAGCMVWCRKSDMPQLHLLIVTYIPPFA